MYLSILVLCFFGSLIGHALLIIVVVRSGRCSAVNYILVLDWPELITFIVTFGSHAYLFSSKTVLLTTSYHFLNTSFLLMIVVILSVSKHKS